MPPITRTTAAADHQIALFRKDSSASVALFHIQRLHQDSPATELLPLRIVSRAEAPAEPTRPNRGFDFIVTLVVAAFLSVMMASFVEIVFLFLRAGERLGN